MKYKTIVFVCSGNTCRSPMAEAAMRQELKKRKISWYKIRSAGLSARDGAPMTAESKQALTEAKIPFSADFAARRLTKKIIDGAYAVVCLTSAHERALAGYPNVTSLQTLCGREISDPYGRGIDVYRVTLREIRECLPRVIQILCPPIEDGKN